jgi:protein-disulfide isomerase
MTKEAKILIAIMVVVVAGGLFAALSGGPAVNKSELLARENSYRSGNGTVEVVEFGDYQCPACAQVHPTVTRLQEEYEGRITFIFRNFPLSSHKNALPSAEAAEAAGAQGKYWAMHDMLYENQDEWSGVADPMGIFIGYATDLGLDIDTFRHDYGAKKYLDSISNDQSDGYRLGVQGTPTFFVNGKQQRSFDYDALKNAIEAELK